MASAFIVVLNMLVDLVLVLVICCGMLKFVRLERRTSTNLSLCFRLVLIVVFVTRSIVSNELVLCYVV